MEIRDGPPAGRHPDADLSFDVSLSFLDVADAWLAVIVTDPKGAKGVGPTTTTAILDLLRQLAT